MPERLIDGKMLIVNDEGYLVDPNQWSIECARVFASELEIPLSQAQMELIHWARKHVLDGKELTIRAITRSGIVDARTLYSWFPGAPLKNLSKIAGLAKPSGCF